MSLRIAGELRARSQCRYRHLGRNTTREGNQQSSHAQRIVSDFYSLGHINLHE
ncbi:hypothetical protein [Actinomyces mediterranea]|uniref:hypothetical protein n=1 Tax=Actinomyces mediterranea TaxID=1871028 RepID=UPI00135669B8|nr:hypothetical protein [Actinomyces mediterranea]